MVQLFKIIYASLSFINEMCGTSNSFRYYMSGSNSNSVLMVELKALKGLLLPDKKGYKHIQIEDRPIYCC